MTDPSNEAAISVVNLRVSYGEREILHGISFDVLFYGAPAVAALTVIVSFFTARRRWGIVVPVFALALLVTDITILAVTVA